MWSIVAQWLEHRCVNTENPGSYPGLLWRIVDKFVHDCCSSLFSCMNENMAIDSGGCLCTNGLRVLTSA